MTDDREKDKSFKLVPAVETGKSRYPVSIDSIKSAFIAEGLGSKEIAERFHLTVTQINEVIEKHQLVELRKAYIREGISKIQNVQLNQAQKIMELELNFKKMRIVQLEKQLEDFAAYYARHGDFCKRHPVSGEILKNSDGIPMQLSLPSVVREVNQLKETLTLSEGLKKLLVQVDDILNKPRELESVGNDDDIIDVDNYEDMFKKKV